MKLLANTGHSIQVRSVPTAGRGETPIIIPLLFVRFMGPSPPSCHQEFTSPRLLRGRLGGGSVSEHLAGSMAEAGNTALRGHSRRCGDTWVQDADAVTRNPGPLLPFVHANLG